MIKPHHVKRIGLAIVFLWFMGGGIMHFTHTDFFLNIMPPYVPMHLEAVYVSGFFEILGALALLTPVFRSAAGWGLILLTLAVTPANIHMWLHPERYPEMSPALLSARLVIQVMLIVCIYWSSRPDVMPSVVNKRKSVPRTV